MSSIAAEQLSSSTHACGWCLSVVMLISTDSDTLCLYPFWMSLHWYKLNSVCYSAATWHDVY